MAVRKILRLGDPRLRQKCEPVPENEVSSKEIKNIIKDMYQSMKAADGLGLAAPQIGILKRIVVVGFEQNQRYPEVKSNVDFQAYINPEIKILDGKPSGMWEGCLSVPDMRGYVERIRKIQLKWIDTKGEKHNQTIEGFEAVIFQHECDHLDGTLYVDRLKDPTMFGFNSELEAASEEE